MSLDGKGEAVAVGFVAKVFVRGSSGDVTMILLKTIRAGFMAKVKKIDKGSQKTLGSKVQRV